ncbi:MAG: type I glyceraldehyde-3-phosphate dehydrogenase [Peptococcaceae bacterium]|nr:type I glyceraldehyde-3-phosphate dehydrogenase [Peptococcaceae bacterium]
MAVKLGINGFGRIGKLVLRGALTRPEFEVAAVNHKSRRIAVSPDYGRALAHSFKYDSVHGRFEADVDGDRDTMRIGDAEIKVFAFPDPGELPWRDLGVDIVIESTGRFRDGKEAARHLQAGAKKVIISAPAKNEDITVVMGVNQEKYEPDRHHIISNASCTTNCLAPVAKVLHRKYGIRRGLINTIHAFTNGQQILDMPYRDPRRARAATMSIIPTTTGAAKAVGKVLPELNGRLNGFAMRVPVPNVSVVDLVAELEKPASVDDINATFKEAAENDMKGILAYCDLPLVSSDFNGDSHSAIVDGLSTMLIDKDFVKVVAWYDNEWGYSQRLLDLASYIASKGL